MGLFGGSKNPEDLINSAMALMQRKQPKAALSLFKKSLKNDPENVIALYNQGLAFNQLKKYQDAISCFDKVIEINPKMHHHTIIEPLLWQKLEIQMTQ